MGCSTARSSALPSTTGPTTSCSERARQSIEGTGREARREDLRPVRRATLVRQRRLRRQRRRTSALATRSAAPRHRSSTSRSRPSSSARRQGPRRGRPDEDRAGRRREAVRPRPRVRRRAGRRVAPVHRRVPALPHRPLPREDGPRGDPPPPVPQLDARADLEPQLPRVRADHDGRELRGRGSRPLLRPGRRVARRRRQPPDAGRGGGGDGGAVPRRPERRSRTRRSRSSTPSPRPIRPTTCAASTTATSTSTASRRTRRPRPSPRCGSTSRTGAGSGVPFFIRTGKRLPATQTELRLVFKHRAEAVLRNAPREHAGAEPARHQARPVDRDQAHRQAHRADEPGSAAIELDMEFAEEGGEGPTPYEVLLHAAMVGDSTRFTRQDGVEETWRIMQPLLDAPPPGAQLRTRVVGARGGERARGGPWPLARAVGGRNDRRLEAASRPSRAPPRPRRSRRSRSTRSSPTATPARSSRPDGAIDWLCVPRFDAPSIFGSLLDREAGFFRFAPFGINHPTARAYVPGTNVLETTWKTPNGWIVVRDALTMGPWDQEDVITPHTRPPADDDADHMLVRTVECIEGSVEVELICEPVVRLRPHSGGLDGCRRRPSGRRRVRCGANHPSRVRSPARHRGQPGPRPAHPRAG